MCGDCSIVQDVLCSIKENASSIEMILTVPSNDTLAVYASKSSANITVDDSREPECCECRY